MNDPEEHLITVPPTWTHAEIEYSLRELQYRLRGLLVCSSVQRRGYLRAIHMILSAHRQLSGAPDLDMLVVQIRINMLIVVSNPDVDEAPSLTAISRFADFFGLGLRKEIKAMVGDYDVEIKRIYTKEKRPLAAKWQVALAWGYTFWYVCKRPISVVWDYVFGSLKAKQ